MGDERITYVPLPGTTPEGELAVLATVYSFLLDRHREKAAGTNGGENVEKGLDDGSRRDPIVPE